MYSSTCAWHIPIGMPAWTIDGHRLGTVIAAITHVIVVERGWLARQRFVLRPDDIADVRDGAIHLRGTLAELETTARIP
jgi:hypothetical protein